MKISEKNTILGCDSLSLTLTDVFGCNAEKVRRNVPLSNVLRLFVVLITSLVLVASSSAGVLVFDLEPNTILREYDFEGETPSLEIDLSEIIPQLKSYPRLESAYLRFNADISDRTAAANDLANFRVCSFHIDGQIARNTSHCHFNSPYGKHQLMIFDLTNLLHHWQRDGTLPTKLAVVRSRDAAKSLRLSAVDFSTLQLTVRYSDSR